MAWDERLVEPLIKAVRQDIDEERFSRDVWGKLRDRRLSRGQMRAVITKDSYIVFYVDRMSGQPRFGFWHPRMQLVVSWRPDVPTRIATIFPRDDGRDYLLRLMESKLVWEPR